MIEQKLIWSILQEEILMDEDLMQVLPNYADVKWNSEVFFYFAFIIVN